MRESPFEGVIEIKAIPHKEQRYDTAGDWWWDEDGWHIRVSRLSSWRYQLLVVFHELLEMSWCRWHGVDRFAVDAFDIEYERKRSPGDLSEPGDDPNAPYHSGHQFATAIERMVALVLGVNWTKYEDELCSLDYHAS